MPFCQIEEITPNELIRFCFYSQMNRVPPLIANRDPQGAIGHKGESQAGWD